MADDDDFVRPVRGSRWADSLSRDALQTIVEGVSAVAGFDLVGVCAARDDGYLHVLAVVGPDEAMRALHDTIAPTQPFLEQLEVAEDWGPLKWIPHDRLTLDVDRWGWFSDASREGVPDGVWHPEDSLVAPLEDDQGGFIGYLGMELPRDGLVPNAEKRAMLEVYVRQATQAIRTALDRERLAEQVRIANAAADIVRLAAGSDSADEVLVTCGHQVAKGFRADSLWVQWLGPDHRCRGPLYVDGGEAVRLPPGVRSLLTAHAQRAWERQCVAVLAPDRPMPGVLAEDQAAMVLEFLAGVEVESLLLVPVGAGADCFGVMGLARGRRGAEWSADEADAALDIARDLGRAMREHQLVRELREVADYRGRMVATVAHELKNPVSAVLGYAEILAGEPELPESARAAVAAIQRGGARLDRVVEDLLALHGTVETEPTQDGRGDLGAIVGDVVELNAALAASLGIDLRAVRPAEPVVARADDRELEHVVTNLVSNALKYSQRGGSVVVTVSCTGDEAILTVVDDGIGIAPEDQELVFEEFFRSSDPAAAGQPGTGLGLAIVRRVVERYDGQLDLVSEPGHGSVFRVILPLA